MRRRGREVGLGLSSPFRGGTQPLVRLEDPVSPSRGGSFSVSGWDCTYSQSFLLVFLSPPWRSLFGSEARMPGASLHLPGFYGSRGTLYNDLSCPQFPYKLSLWFPFLPRGRVPLGTPLGSVGPSGPCSWYGGWQTAESARLPPSALRAAVGVRVRVRDTRYIRGLALRAGRPPAPHSPQLLRPPSLAWNLSSLNPGRAGLGDRH